MRMIEGRDLTRWMLSGAVVLLAHAGAAAALINWPVQHEGEPTAALVIELAAIPAAPETPQTEAPPDPIIQEMAPEPPPPEEVAELRPEEPPPDPPPPEEPPPPPDAIALEPPPPVKEEPPPPPPKPKQAVTTAPKPQKRIAPVAAAPAQGMPTESMSTALPTWRSALGAHIQRHLRYPSGGRDDGVAFVAFTVDRSGNVLSARLARSAGDGALDDEAVACVRRAAPMPRPPEGMSGGSFSLVVPVRFHR